MAYVIGCGLLGNPSFGGRTCLMDGNSLPNRDADIDTSLIVIGLSLVQFMLNISNLLLEHAMNHPIAISVLTDMSRGM